MRKSFIRIRGKNLYNRFMTRALGSSFPAFIQGVIHMFAKDDKSRLFYFDNETREFELNTANNNLFFDNEIREFLKVSNKKEFKTDG